MANVLEIVDLRTEFHLRTATVGAVDGVSFTVGEGECLGLVGESGCGKSTVGLSIMKLLPNVGHVVRGTVTLLGKELVKMPEKQMRDVRGNNVAMIFQYPMTSLNPTMTVGRQIAEPVRVHKQVSKKEATDRAIEVLQLVGMPRPAERIASYPHQLSGGLRQRVMIAIALSCEPKLLIADEPTTALDVTIQRQILDLIKEIQVRTGTALLLITHDLGVVAETVERVAVMYAGRIVETGSVEEVLLHPRHPYTRGLLQSIPSRGTKGKPLAVIKGVVPNPLRMPPGCKFQPRCPYAFDRCAEEPELIAIRDGRATRCWLEDRAYASRLSQYLTEPGAAGSTVPGLATEAAPPSPSAAPTPPTHRQQDPS